MAAGRTILVSQFRKVRLAPCNVQETARRREERGADTQHSDDLVEKNAKLHRTFAGAAAAKCRLL